MLHVVLVAGVRISTDCVAFSTCCWCLDQHCLCYMLYLLLLFGSTLTVLHVVLVAGVWISIDCVTCNFMLLFFRLALTVLHVILVAGVRISIFCMWSCS